MGASNVAYLAGTIAAFFVFALTLAWVSRRK
jgi:hypothetical protein